MPPRLLQYQLPGGWEVLVGRTDADNDYLSLKVAEPADWWFHVGCLPRLQVVASPSLQRSIGGQDSSLDSQHREPVRHRVERAAHQFGLLLK